MYSTLIYLLSGILTFPITVVLTIAGVGAAFILIPFFTTLGIDLYQAMAIALLLNALAMISASIRYARKGLILWKLSIPLIIASSIGAPLGVQIGHSIDVFIIRIIFIGFLLFATVMILSGKEIKDDSAGTVSFTPIKTIIAGLAGLCVGILAGLIGVGGGNIILPVLMTLGIKPRQAVGTTALVVIFSSSSGFISHVGASNIDFLLVAVTTGASIAGAVVGSWLMTDKLNPKVIKYILAIVLIAVAIKMTLNLL